MFRKKAQQEMELRSGKVKSGYALGRNPVEDELRRPGVPLDEEQKGVVRRIFDAGLSVPGDVAKYIASFITTYVQDGKRGDSFMLTTPYMFGSGTWVILLLEDAMPQRETDEIECVYWEKTDRDREVDMMQYGTLVVGAHNQITIQGFRVGSQSYLGRFTSLGDWERFMNRRYKTKFETLHADFQKFNSRRRPRARQTKTKRKQPRRKTQRKAPIRSMYGW